MILSVSKISILHISETPFFIGEKSTVPPTKFIRTFPQNSKISDIIIIPTCARTSRSLISSIPFKSGSLFFMTVITNGFISLSKNFESLQILILNALIEIELPCRSFIPTSADRKLFRNGCFLPHTPVSLLFSSIYSRLDKRQVLNQSDSIRPSVLSISSSTLPTFEALFSRPRYSYTVSTFSRLSHTLFIR